ncbi:hypothetical protein ScPMuIL_002936 [Solemya velum]
MEPEHFDVDLEEFEFVWTPPNFNIELPPTPTEENEFPVDEDEILSSIVLNETDMELQLVREPTATGDATNASSLPVDYDVEIRFKTSTEKEINAYFEARQAPATKKNTAWGMRVFQDWNIENFAGATDMAIVPVEVLADRMKTFYCEARPKHSDELYHKNTLINIRAAINRHLADLKGMWILFAINTSKQQTRKFVFMRWDTLWDFNMNTNVLTVMITSASTGIIFKMSILVFPLLFIVLDFEFYVCDIGFCTTRERLSPCRKWHFALAFVETAFSENGFNTLTVLDPDLQYLIDEEHYEQYYFFQEVNEVYCKKEFCNDFNMVCENDGYVSRIRDKCTCRCLEGLDPSSGCTQLETTDTSLQDLTWPDGDYTILATIAACPHGFERGSLRVYARYGVEFSRLNHFAEEAGTELKLDFCTKVSTTSNPAAWEPGRYCILRHGSSCPDGFEKGYISIDGDDTLPTMSGVMPDTSYVSGSDNIKLKFCCRNDRDTYDPMKLPTSSPFILLQEFEGGCQEVIGYYSIDKATPPCAATSGFEIVAAAAIVLE